jgi:hypothetical protein
MEIENEIMTNIFFPCKYATKKIVLIYNIDHKRNSRTVRKQITVCIP